MSLLSSLNPARLGGEVRQPRPLITVNGVALSGVIEAEVTNASHFTADSFRVVATVSGLPRALGPDYWALSDNDQLGIAVGLADSIPTPLILGQVDTSEYDPIRRTLTLSGRDLSAQLIDTKTAEKFQNKTSSDIAQLLALRHGLDSSVAQTTAKVGTYYNIDHVILTQEQSEWDLLVYLATQEEFDVWVSGTTLYFQPSPVETATPYTIISPAPGTIDSNATDIKVSRSQTLAKDIIVKIRTWNQKQQKGFTITYKASQASKGQRAGGNAQTYSYTVPNLTRDQALRLAKSTAEDITRHERVLIASLPGDGLLTTRAMVQLVGTGTAWDQNYYPDTVTRTISMDNGYRMELRAKNHSTQSTVVLG